MGGRGVSAWNMLFLIVLYWSEMFDENSLCMLACAAAGPRALFG